MDQILKAYQQYSGQERKASILNGLAYAKEQVDKYRKRSAASNRALDEFSIRYGIKSTSGDIRSNGNVIGKYLTRSTLDSLDSIGSIGSVGSVGSVGSNSDALNQLASINQELIRRQQKFTNSDPGVKALINQRDALRKFIEVTGGGSLAFPGGFPTSKEQTQELLLKFQEIERTAKRDTSTLDSLESMLLSLQLDQARSSTPWELISKPTLFDNPVSPRPAQNLVLGLLAGFFGGSAAALVVDRRSGCIFSKDKLLAALPSPLLAELPAQNPAAWEDTLQLLAHHSLQGSSLAVMPLGDVSHQSCLSIVNSLNKAGLSKVTICRSLLEAEKYDHHILLSSEGSLNRRGLTKLLQEVRLQSKSALGWIWLANGTSDV